ncbi:hypothetical protein C8R44DRAFT_744735 [Mycena epipterygia]|nr:hypothetical protein C8R44DRAFT_744735 [Mycena epipterygia]
MPAPPNSNSTKGASHSAKPRMKRELRRERALHLLSLPELLKLICELSEQKFANTGGQAGWYALPIEEQDRLNAALHGELCQRYGRDLFEALSPKQKCEVDLFFWFEWRYPVAGCRSEIIAPEIEERLLEEKDS